MQLFDLHCDTLGLGAHKKASFHAHDGHVDACKGRAYRPWVQVFAAFLPDGLTPAEARAEYAALRGVAHNWQGDDFRLIRRAGEVDPTFHGCHGLLTVENAGVLADVTVLDALAADGVALVGLTWNGDNAFACGCLGHEYGLTPLGVQAVERLNSLAVPIDVSHLNESGFWQVLKMAKQPIVASHSCSRAVCDHPRNLTDDQFRAIRDGGGLVGLNVYPPFVGGDDFASLRRHVEHFLHLNGEKAICFGADFDGMTPPNDWNGVAVMERIWQYLQSCGYSLDFLNNLFYNNAYQFFSKL